jgi:hypothetical protein
MTVIKNVIRQLLLADSTIANALAKYRFADGEADQPAIFTGYQVPEDTKFPVIVLVFVGGSDFGCRAQRGAVLHVDVQVYDDKEMSTKALDDLAFAIWKCCDRAELSTYLGAEGYEDWGCTADAPVATSDPESYPGYQIKVHARVLEKEA